MDFTERLKDALSVAPTEGMFEYRGRDFSRGEINAIAESIIGLLDRAGVPVNARVGVVVRNRPLHAAAMLGLIAHGRVLTAIYAIQSPEAMAREIASSGFGAVMADVQDWTPEVEAAVRATGAAGLELDHDVIAVKLRDGFEEADGALFSTIDGERGIEILSSGTTGPPKRILFPFRMLVRAVESVSAGRFAGTPDAEILTWPYGGIGGMCNLVAGAVLQRNTVLLDKFNVAEWVAAVRKHRPVTLSGPPAVARMALDAGVTRDDLSSVRYFFGGGAPFSPELQEEFEAAYDIKVIWAYGATEFCGTIISWTPALHETHRDSKKGAMGRALPGISLRITDPATRAPLAPGKTGYLEAIVPAVGEHWIRTTDLASIDEDGFVFHGGRGDGAIFRGGFKVLPEKIVTALQQHPAVLDAAVVGIPDARLGEVPVAVVQLRDGAIPVSAEELRAYARTALVVHHVPVRIAVVDALPRTTSLKPDLAAVRALFAPADGEPAIPA